MIIARLKKRGTIALIAYFLLITAVCAPLAFFAGRTQGKVETGSGADMSQNEPDLRADYAALYRARRAGAGCGGETDPDMERRAHWEIICHPVRDGAGGPLAGFDPRHAAPRERGPLDDVMVASLAGAGSAGNIGSPISLAMAPDGGLFSGPGYQGHTMSGGFGAGGFGGDLFGGPNAPGGLPGNIIPNIENAVNNPDPPPTVVTPIPGALPLLLTGFAGLFAASRRRKRS